jgi:hypothetical protein
MKWISVEDQPIDLKCVAFVLTQDKRTRQITQCVSIYEHEKILYDLLTATHWMPLPELPDEK